MNYKEFYESSIKEPEKFWKDQANELDWKTKPKEIEARSSLSINYISSIWPFNPALRALRQLANL